MKPKSLVRDGYDAIARDYLAARGSDSDDVRLLDDLIARLPDGARVLDGGCGAGEPVTRILNQRCAVTGLDISRVQLALAHAAIPDASFVQGDLTALPFADATFDALVSYYALIHVPRDEHATALDEFRRVLRPGGLALLSMGVNDNPDDIDQDWLGAGAPMYWSHYGHAVNLGLVQAAGFAIVWERLIAEDAEFGGGRHLVVLGRVMGDE